ncbi:hypothetical protein FA13DRAFT_1797822 [Coprinellus micaceus]|uniref:Protein YOP1 n=1 Tax=Coprinellus micaceus TaxID=71717 RepID=A0A4Y7SPM9_COPMI|nr:hypothetical protein FA13DRAFT_1797822 [Coprinellus micaceus]
MAIFVPALRLIMLFLNVYDSYKTLKPPQPSVRDPTRPSVRAMTQRKRDMKGCLAVWVVFCCFTSYERIVESLVSIFIPFYDEFKSMFMLFLIFTRARGAEPIFLHIVRPVIKPYTTTMDGTLELLRMTGDFLFALSAYPVHIGKAWWRRRFGPKIEAYDSDSETTTTENTTHSREAAQHEVWVPPASAYEDVIEDVDAPPEIIELTQEERAVDEWRQYPAFPSAYPTSPLLTTSFFPPNTASFGGAMQMGSYPPSASASHPGFPRSLPSSRNTVNPSYANDSSDHTGQPSGFNQASGNPSTYGESHQIYSDEEDHHGDSMDEDYDPHHHSLFSGSEVGTDDDEDVFNMTLRTPLPPHGAARSRALMSRITIPLPAPLGSANSMSTTVPSARTSASTFRTASSRGSDPDSLEPSPTDGSGGLLSASSATLVPGADAGLGLVMGDDLSKTLVEQPQGVQAAAAKKRKAVNSTGLLDLTESSDAGDNEDDDEAEMDADGDDEVEEEGDEDVYIPSEQQEMKRRKVQVGKPGAAGVVTTTSSKNPAQPRAAVRKPLAARQSDGQLRSTGTSSASQQATKGHVKSASVSAVGKARTSANVNATTTATKPGQARTGAPATRGARGGAKPATNIGRGAAPSAMRGKVGSGVTKKSSTATLSAVSRTGSTGSNTSNDS